MTNGEVAHEDPPGRRIGPLATWLRENLDADINVIRPHLRAGGRSNVSYRLDGSSLGPLVLRRPPLGHILPTAHDMGREFTLLTGLATVGFPVPRAHALCTDVEVIGTPFVIMDFVEGLVIADAADARLLDQASARLASQNLVTALAALHAINPDDAGLGQLGRPDGYLSRQVSRWVKQWDLTCPDDYPIARELIEWLQKGAANLPEQAGVSIVHGDLRLDNTIVDPASLEILAVLDWEMSTLGDPLLDVAVSLLYLTESSDTLRRSIPVAQDVTSAPGFFTREEFLASYCAITSIDTRNLDFCLALACFKLAAILESIKHRSQAGEQLGTAENSGDLFDDSCTSLLSMGLAVTRGMGLTALNL